VSGKRYTAAGGVDRHAGGMARGGVHLAVLEFLRVQLVLFLAAMTSATVVRDQLRGFQHDAVFASE
jgi:hypothetical protein